MTKFHLSGSDWKRCRAFVRPGYGVAYCSLGEDNHAEGQKGIAERGGGIITRTVNGEIHRTIISAIEKDGSFTAESAQGFVRVYDANGKLVPLRERAKKKAPLEDFDTPVEAQPHRPNPIRERIEAAGITYPLDWDEMGSSEKDLWEDRQIEALDKATWQYKAPNLAALVDYTEDEWFELSWTSRQIIATNATQEAIRIVRKDMDFADVGSWGGWMRSKNALGYNKRSLWGGVNSVHLSTVALKYRGPAEVTNTILHEIAHSVSSYHADHGSEWRSNFRKVLDHFGMEEAEVMSHAHSMTDREVQAFEEQYTQQRWVGICSNNPEHKSYRAGKPRSRYVCAKPECRDLPSEERDIRYSHNPNYKP